MTRTRETGTKIVATIGPASWDPDTLEQLLLAGVDVCRINCSHSDHAGIRRQVSRIRGASMRLGQPVAILLDLQGPKIRVGKIDGELVLKTGDTLTILMDESHVGTGPIVGTTYPELIADVVPGVRVLFADGAISGTVSEVHPKDSPGRLVITIEYGGVLTSNKGINLPGVPLSTPSLTDKDRADLAVGLEVGVDYVALSFVRQAQDVKDLQDEMERLGCRVPCIAKIEKPQAVENIEAILDYSEGVMVARGDLGVEVNIECVPVYQKLILEAAFRRGALSITATQMLDSMERNPRPTRAETTDVANAILDGTDAVMLSGETATGLYPIEAVRTMDNIAREVEASPFFKTTDPADLPPTSGPGGAVWRAACFSVHEDPRPLVVFTWSGQSAMFASRARPRQPIFALTPDPKIVDRLSLVWGVTPVLIPDVRSTDQLLALGEEVLLENGHLKVGDEVIMLVGQSPLKGAENLLKILTVGGE
jgi:pyruvate kinase